MFAILLLLQSLVGSVRTAAFDGSGLTPLSGSGLGEEGDEAPTTPSTIVNTNAPPSSSGGRGEIERDYHKNVCMHICMSLRVFVSIECECTWQCGL